MATYLEFEGNVITLCANVFLKKTRGMIGLGPAIYTVCSLVSLALGCPYLIV